MGIQTKECKDRSCRILHRGEPEHGAMSETEVQGGTMGTNPVRTCGSDSGFTLTELLVSMVLAGVVMAGLYSAYLTQQRAYETTENVTRIQQNLRSAMYFLERDLRMAGFDPEDAGVFGFTDVNSGIQDSVRFTLDVDEDGALNGTTEYIAYKLEGNRLKRDPGTDVYQPVALDISGVTFAFYDSSGTTTVNESSIRYVDITIRSERGGHARDLNTRILCRNMGL